MELKFHLSFPSITHISNAQLYQMHAPWGIVLLTSRSEFLVLPYYVPRMIILKKSKNSVVV
jgi:hypothetical protein